MSHIIIDYQKENEKEKQWIKWTENLLLSSKKNAFDDNNSVNSIKQTMRSIEDDWEISQDVR